MEESAHRRSSVIDRPRLERRLAGSHPAAISVVVGPAGAGKSELVRRFAQRSASIYFRAGTAGGTLARFVHGLAQALAPVAPGAQASFPRAWERALQSRNPSTVLGHWLCEHVLDIDARLVIDDLHDAAADPAIAEFIATIAELRADAPLTLAARTVGALPIGLWMATGRLDREIEEAELRFDHSELAAAAAAAGLLLDDTAFDALAGATAGSPIAVAYALARLREDPAALARALPATFDAIAAEIFGRRTGHERAFLLSAALYPSVNDAILALSGWDDAAAIRAAIGSDAPFIWERGSADGLVFHDRFRAFVARAFAARDREMRETIARRTVRSLAIAGRYADALEVATRQGLRAEMVELLDGHGFEILESGEIGVIGEALAALDAPQTELGAVALALRGYLDARADRADTAEAWFLLALDRAADETAKVAIAMYYARELALRRRPDAHEVLEPFATSTTLPRALLVDVRSAYAQALTAAGRLAEASAFTDEALALLEPHGTPALRARVLARAAYVARECGDIDRARTRGEIAAPLAVAQSLYDVAASTYSVLYNVAYDVDDDAAAALDHLRQLRDLGVKSGTLRLDLYAQIAMYELQAEMGDADALATLDRSLAAADKHDATATILEALVPAKALQAGWNGHFADAARILRPAADHQPTRARKALCWAQIALYSAASAATADAVAAEAAAEASLDPGASEKVQTGLTLLTLGFAAWLRDDLERARRWRAAADAAIGSAPRLRALRTALAALIAAHADPAAFAGTVPAALEGLRANAFAGIARLIEALPEPGSIRAGQPATVGAIVAGHQLPARFEAAVAADDAATLHTWLADPSARSLGDATRLRLRFDAWAAVQPMTTVARRAAIAHIRRELARYQYPDRPMLRLVDDVDDAIETLIRGLEIAAPLMGEHSRAVSAWCSRLGRLLGLNEEEILFVTRCGLIHDVGKMRTPPEILNAPRRLSAQEWEIMADHAAEGGRIVAALPTLRPFTPIVHGHHERIDGKGYPDGLRTSSIPLAARIVAVADSFNAMIGRRTYRLPLPPSEALNELERHRGTQFDPEIVEAMIRIVTGSITEAGVRPLSIGTKS